MTKQEMDTSDTNPSDDEIRTLLQRAKRVAVVGLSDKPDRDSYRVAAYLLSKGYEIIPINPSLDQVLGRKCYKSLKDVPGQIDVVDVFRKSDSVGPIVDEAIEANAKAVWLQLGVVNDDAVAKAIGAGLLAVQNRCMKQEHTRLIGG